LSLYRLLSWYYVQGVLEKKVSHLIEILVGILLKIRLLTFFLDTLHFHRIHAVYTQIHSPKPTITWSKHNILGSNCIAKRLVFLEMFFFQYHLLYEKIYYSCFSCFLGKYSKKSVFCLPNRHEQ